MAINKSNIIKDNRNIPFDYDLSGEVNIQGELPELYGKAALDNALVLWIVSQKGEYIRKPNRGGYVYFYLMKSLNDDTAVAIEQSILDGLAIDFNNDFEVPFIRVTPDYENRQWSIQLQVYSKRLKLFTTTEVSLQSS